jgi:hypothetical protein
MKVAEAAFSLEAARLFSSLYAPLACMNGNVLVRPSWASSHRFRSMPPP